MGIYGREIKRGWTVLTNEEGFLEIDLKNARRLGIRNPTCAPEEAGRRDWCRGHAELGRNKVKQKFLMQRDFSD